MTTVTALVVHLVCHLLLQCSHCGKPEIANLHLVILRQKDIRRLKVTMNDLLGMNIRQSLKNPPNYLYLNLILLKPCRDELLQRNPPYKLHNDV